MDITVKIETNKTNKTSKLDILLLIPILLSPRLQSLLGYITVGCQCLYTFHARLTARGSWTRLLTFCFRNLLRRKVRTTLCILGVAIAATFVIAVGATSIRYATVIQEMDVLFHGQVTVVSKDDIVIQAIPIPGDTFPQDLTVEQIEDIPGVSDVTPVLFLTFGSTTSIQLVPGNFTIGIPVADWELALGPIVLRRNGHFPANDSSNEVVAGGSLADQYGWTVGTEIQVENSTLRVSGVLDTKMAVLNRCLVMPLSLAQSVYTYPGMVNIIAVKPVQNVPEQNLSETINTDAHLTYLNVKALTETQRNDMIQPILGQLQTWTVGTEAVVFIISLILVMTVTVMSVSERRRDFATLDAMGATASYVFRVVILEACLIGVLGGVIGVVLGSMGAIVLASLYTSIPVALFFPSIFEIVPPLFMLEMFAAIVGICCVGGVIPAANAMRMRIAEVLRAEY
jgi:putative ABC transport system permease protein